MTRSRVMVGVGLACVAVAALFLGPLGEGPEVAQAAGVSWRSETLDEALEEARARGTRVLVKFDAAWCSYCRTLDEELLATPEGAALTDDLVAVRFDFDDPENRPLVERFVVLGLPTVLVLTPDGAQMGRITGYESKAAFVAELTAAKTADDPIPALRETLAAAPDDATAMVALGEALLVRGETAEGEALLGRVAWRGGREGDDATTNDRAAEALFLLGRYHHRVRRDAAQARHVWRELATRFPDDARAGGAVWWFAKAEADLGHPEAGLAALRDWSARAGGDDAERVMMVGDYVVEHEEALAGEGPAALAEVRRLRAGLDEDDDDDDTRAAAPPTAETREALDALAAKLAGLSRGG